MAVAVDVVAEDTGDDANAGDDEGEADEALKIGVTEPSSKQKRRDWRGGDRGDHGAENNRMAAEFHCSRAIRMVEIRTGDGRSGLLRSTNLYLVVTIVDDD